MNTLDHLTDITDIQGFRRFLSHEREFKEKTRIKECFCYNDDCDHRIINAHSIQNNKVLSVISENGCVLEFKQYHNDNRIKYNLLNYYLNDLKFASNKEKKAYFDKYLSLLYTFGLKQQGRKKASVFSGFCNRHDTMIFSRIEQMDYRNEKEQNFLFAYRAFAKNYHDMRTLKKKLQVMRKEVQHDDDYLSLGIDILYLLPFYVNKSNYYSLLFDSLEDLKPIMNNNLDSDNFDNIETECIVLNKEYHMATVNTINNIEYIDGKINIYPLFITIFPQNGKTYILLSYMREHKHKFSYLYTHLLNKNVEDQLIIISLMILKNYASNFYLSPTSWNNLPTKRQDRIINFYNDQFRNSMQSFTVASQYDEQTFEQYLLTIQNLSKYSDLNLFM